MASFEEAILPDPPRIKSEFDEEYIATFVTAESDAEVIISDDEEDEFDDIFEPGPECFIKEEFAPEEFTLAELIPPQSQVIDCFHEDLNSSFTRVLGRTIDFKKPGACCRTLNSEIRFELQILPVDVDWCNLQAQTRDAVMSSRFMVGSWLTPDGDINIIMTINPLAAYSADRYAVADEGNAQICLLTTTSHQCTPLAWNDEAATAEYQDIANILKADLRLNHHDVSQTLKFLARNRVRWQDISDPVLQTTVAALKLYLASPHSTNGSDAVYDVNHALRLENSGYCTTVQMQQQRQALIGVWFSGTCFLNSVRTLAPSFFLANGQHVHVMENIASKSTPERSTSIKILRKNIGVAMVSRVVTTQPQRLQDGQHLFRVTGMQYRGKSSRQLSAALRTALKITSDIYQGPKLAVSVKTRIPVRWVFVLRQSTEDGTPPRTSIPRQIWTMLCSNDAPFKTPAVGDKISVVIELCSSNKHPIRDRNVFAGIPSDLPIVFLTANPDRLTRRSDKVAIILKRGQWWTRGVGNQSREWVDVSKQQSLIEQQIMIGRHTASEVGKYSLMKRAIIRTMSAAEKDDSQYHALRYIVAEAFRLHDISVAVIVCRVSPPARGTTERDGVKPSLLRQQRFIESLVPDGIPVSYVKAKEISAYKEDFLEVLSTELASIPKAIVLSTSVDRISRNSKSCELLRIVHETYGHMFMSFLWSDDTELPLEDALYLSGSLAHPNLVAADQVLEQQRRSPPSNRNCPVVKPVLWIPCAPNLQDYVDSKVSAAESYACASALRFQGEPSAHIPAALTKVPTRPFDKTHTEQWDEFLNSQGHYPKGGKYGKYCSKTCKTADDERKKAIMKAKSKRNTKNPGKVLTCTRKSCDNTKVQGGQWGHYCSAECKMAGEDG
ncbi:unnamed protein product [Aureobasidium vineae]|uniref:Uncharacterized protein n=1 Tax=Aureobasidium vineae TaxID=2773715 RepID=A0A9N8P6M8_9PEZI|nr:unnamed protein product [Aureobasidium vineae]